MRLLARIANPFGHVPSQIFVVSGRPRRPAPSCAWWVPAAQTLPRALVESTRPRHTFCCLAALVASEGLLHARLADPLCHVPAQVFPVAGRPRCSAPCCARWIPAALTIPGALMVRTLWWHSSCCLATIMARDTCLLARLADPLCHVPSQILIVSGRPRRPTSCCTGWIPAAHTIPEAFMERIMWWSTACGSAALMASEILLLTRLANPLCHVPR